MRTKILATTGMLALALGASYKTFAPAPLSAADVGPQMTSDRSADVRARRRAVRG